MGVPLESEKIRRILDLARAQINQQEPSLALENLRIVQNEIDQLGGSTERANFSLLVAEAYCAKREEVAETYLEEAAEKIHALPSPPAELEFRLFERFGDFYGSVSRKFTKARDYYGRAKALAITLGVAELVARIELKIVRIDLDIDHDPEQHNFKALRRIGRRGNFTCEQQLAAWHIHYGNSEGSTKGLRFARRLSNASDDYFRNLLNSVRQNPS